MKKVSSSSEKSGTKPSEVAKQIKSLLKELPEIRSDAARLDQLRRVFTRLEAAGELKFLSPDKFGGSSDKNPVAAKWSAFLHKSHDAMVSQLCERVRLGRHASIRCLWGVIAGSPRLGTKKTPIKIARKGDKIMASPPSYKYLNVDLLQAWIRAMTLQESTEMDKGMRHMIDSELLSPYRDVQYFSMVAITKLATCAYDGDYDYGTGKKRARAQKTRVAEKLFELLTMIPVPYTDDDLENRKKFLFPPPLDIAPEDDFTLESDESDEESEESDSDSDAESSDEENSEKDESGTRPAKRQKKESIHKFAYQQIRMFRREYKKAWLAVLRLPLPVTSLKKALHILPQNVLNYVAQPLRFADFFMQAYSDHGSGIIGVLALDGLFLLITKYGLEYENFYTQLYKLVSTKVMYAKYRARFYSLITKCLVLNAMLPAHLVAAFIKRLCRCALSGPPSSILFVLALVSNLLKKHPECNCLVQRKEGTEMEDCFVANEDDPVECRALQSSLWELAVFERHYYPAIATLAKSIGRAEEDKAPLYNVEEFSNHTYASLFDQEKKKKTKTALTFKKSSALFTDDDIFFGCLQIGDN
eukprot:CAMPEP_0201173916 /NCGR_PEP_ID=MMETSP0851-20130426/96817_1 /ASSEMBLY_ACC=CAM_ASM_000631 /TAXON_ID=183588 /ORGANISM="Pseudo-nitzschia fraudulenta, Strain WWA7" /LENGTH=585 /DNA_ID=CAMNT_0047456751 /DNA_START=90 /DNA_END=1847 /DNA_ORIENTATION=+